ncbi:MAG TPA: hypothetical protein EYP76_00780 [Thiomicrorhabdus sp.]|nr:hypothetical protein [Thiomicrorhabdus sp.]
MKLTERHFEFDFSSAIDAFKFDETNNNLWNYHGLSDCMKAVDFIIECEDKWVFIEVKDYKVPNQSCPTDFSQQEEKDKLLKNLVGKYRDTFLYRWAEGKIDKPVQYICLINIEKPLVSYLMNELQRKLPAGKKGLRWRYGIAQSAVVVNIESWNEKFSDWPVTIK